MKKNLEKINSEITDTLKCRLESISLELSDITTELEELAYASESMEAELIEIDDRISVLRSFARKYNTSPSTLYEFLNESLKKLEISEHFEVKLNDLLTSRGSLMDAYNLLADDLHVARIEASKVMSEKVCAKLSELLMPNASFKIEVIKSDHTMTQSGRDSVEFLANFNKDSFLMPLSQVASGGEAARLNFALKTVFGTVGSIETIIFDEVDIGIGGAAAYSMGNAMKTLANDFNTQVISITHSPQVAARANSHILIKKEGSGRNLKVSASKLTNIERINEIARMISGDVINSDARLAAKHLLQEK